MPADVGEEQLQAVGRAGKLRCGSGLGLGGLLLLRLARGRGRADLEPDLEALDGALAATLAAIAKRLESRG